MGNKELLGKVAFPDVPEDEELLEVKLFANVSGAVNTCVILNSVSSMAKIREISVRMKEGIADRTHLETLLQRPHGPASGGRIPERSMSVSGEELLSGQFLVLTPLCTFGNVAYDFHYSEDRLTAQLQGNCGILLRNQYIDPIYNVTPFIQISSTLIV